MDRRIFIASAASLRLLDRIPAARARARGGIAAGNPSPPPGTVPAYIAQLSASPSTKIAQVLPLTNNAYYNAAPTNGNTTYFTAASAIWQTNPGLIPVSGSGTTYYFHLRNVRNWSGGGGDPTNHWAIAHGGGHAGSCYNGVLKYDYNGTTAPTGWSVIPGSETNADGTAAGIQAQITAGDVNQYGDGKPASVHLYGGGLVTQPGVFVRYSGSPTGAGGAPGIVAAFQCDLTNTNPAVNPWTRLPDQNPGASGSIVSAYDPTTNRIYFASENASSLFLDMNTTPRTWSASSKFPTGQVQSSMAYDTKRGRVIMVGGFSSSQYQLANINFATEAVSGFTTFTPTGDPCPVLTTPGGGVGTVYDPLLDGYWLFGAQGVAFDHIYFMDAATFAVTAYQLQDLTNTNFDILAANAGFSQGSYTGFVFMSDWRALGVFTDSDQPAYVIRLPGTGVMTDAGGLVQTDAGSQVLTSN